MYPMLVSTRIIILLSVLCINTAAAAAYLNYVFDDSRAKRKRTISWDLTEPPVPISKEVALLRKDVLVRRGEFGRLEGSRELEVQLECCELKLTFNQALSIRKQLLIKKASKNNWKLKDKDSLERVMNSFQNDKKSLIDIAVQLDLPPVSIIRAILARRVLDRHPEYQRSNRERLTKSIISETDPYNVHQFLSEWELRELQIAKNHDVIGFPVNSTSPYDWEEELYNFLDEHNVNYIKEDGLKALGAKCTPDCLLLDDVYINGRNVRWIECKSYYASGLRENFWFTKKLLKQARKYQREFDGTGAIIMKSGFSERLETACSSTLFLDGGGLATDFICID